MKKKEYTVKYTIDYDTIGSLEEIEPAFGLAKQEAGLAMTDDELIAICRLVRDGAKVNVTLVDCTCNCKKTPWYKRFWNWLKKPFTKKK